MCRWDGFLLTAVYFVASLVLPAYAGQLADIVKDEEGFDGAVRVVERWSFEKGEKGYVTVTVPYLDVRGKEILGQGRLYFVRELFEEKKRPAIYCAAYYELPKDDAWEFCKLGYIVVTPHDKKYPRSLPFGDGYNLAKALIQWVRRLDCVDRQRLQIGGASAGAYMTLAMGAEFFPVSAIMPDMPAINWSYGLNYLYVNQGSSGSLLPEGLERPMPILALTSPAVSLATALFGDDFSDVKWYTLSPISYMNRITAPALVVCATGDTLCTIEHFTAKKLFTLDKEEFPKAYQRDFDTLTLCPQARRRMDECIGPDNLYFHLLAKPKGLYEFTRADAKHPAEPTTGIEKAAELDLPWSKKKQWSLVVLDEGPPLPHTGHRRYYWNTMPRSFMAYYRDRKPEASQLNAPKLRRLMERYAGKLTEVATLTDGTQANCLNFRRLEQLDVVTGLLDYSKTSPKHATRLKQLYLVSSIKPFGQQLILQDLRKIEAELGRAK